jgi:hypothetical protein
MKKKFSEADLAKKVIAWLEGQGWETFKEVEIARGGRADIVAKRGDITWIIETKTSMSVDLLVQCRDRIGKAYYVSAAVPRRGPTGKRILMNPVHEHWLRYYGIGVLSVEMYSDYGIPVYETTAPSLFRYHKNLKGMRSLRSSLNEFHKATEAGKVGVDYFTPYKFTIHQIKEYLKKHGPTKLKDLIKEINHHYASDAGARSTLAKWIGIGEVKGIEMRDGLCCLTSQD